MSWAAIALTGVGIGGAYLGGAFDGPGDMPEAPGFQLPEWAQGLPEETLNLIRQQIGQQVPEPGEYGMASQGLQGLMGYQPQAAAYQLPIEQIMAAQRQQQGLDLSRYQEQLRPTLAGQGQLDSTYYADMLGKYLQGQGAQSSQTMADLQIQQAMQNLNYQQQLQQWTPQFQAGILGQLAGLGGQRFGVGQYQAELPFKTTIPALSGMYSTGLGQAGQQHQAALPQYQAELGQWQQQKAQQQQMMQQLGSLGMSAATGGIGGMAGLYPGISSGMGGFGQGALMGLGGYSPGMAQMFSQLGGGGGYGGGAGGSVYTPTQNPFAGISMQGGANDYYSGIYGR